MGMREELLLEMATEKLEATNIPVLRRLGSFVPSPPASIATEGSLSALGSFARTAASSACQAAVNKHLKVES